MKIRNDYVTNSSSSNFTISLTAVDEFDEMCQFAMMKHDFDDPDYLNVDFGEFTLLVDVSIMVGDKKINIKKQVDEISAEMGEARRIEDSVFFGRLFDIIKAIAHKRTDTLTSHDDKILALAIAQTMRDYDTDPGKIKEIEIERELTVTEINDDTALYTESFFQGWEGALLADEDDEVYAERFDTDVKSIVAYRALMESNYDFNGILREVWRYDVKAGKISKENYMRHGFIESDY